MVLRKEGDGERTSSRAVNIAILLTVLLCLCLGITRMWELCYVLVVYYLPHSSIHPFAEQEASGK